ncbi:nucleotidyltransferase family protein [Aquimarina sp. U1-2]|uniref:nucleotidyltransferase family protein n=1 Tax=Aquimarina sp. U1-2 TaxID=2823141 RepID=UPI001AEC75AC|nr:nucleotidyltransferase family protein [Aquimarina sp. U1-2]MBP2831863.1 nucleotidyltransferase family protein [Aquimarina sp. U1-2]
MNNPLSHIGVLVLAAGASSRMVSVKQLLPFGNSTVIGTILDKVCALQVGKLVVVTGAYPEIYMECKSKSEVLIPIHNRKWRNGMGSSIACGTHFMNRHFKEIKTLLVVLSDQPLLTVGHLKKLIQPFEDLHNDHPDAVATSHRFGRGVPAAFSHRLFPELRKLNDDIGAKSLLSKNTLDCHTIVPDFDTIDIDTKEDYLNLLNK